MIPVNQTVLTEGDGNCVAACVASILELGIDEVPNFIMDEAQPYSWDVWLTKWCAAHGVNARWTRQRPYGLSIGLGTSWRGTDHAVVMKDGRTVHDPNPLVYPGLRSVDEYIVLG